MRRRIADLLQFDLFSAAPPDPEGGLRRIVLGDRLVPYVLRRAARRSLGMSIDHRGLRVAAPPRATLAEIESFVAGHGRWVLKKLDEWQARCAAPPFVVAHGAQLPVLGELHALHLTQGRNGLSWGEGVIELRLASGAAAAEVLRAGLRRRALECFHDRAAHHAPRLDVDVPRLALSNAATRWGSCSRRTGIRLNWRLIHFPLRVVDYVVIHELAHLIEMNHSSRFWAAVGRACPDYAAVRAELKGLAASCPQF